MACEVEGGARAQQEGGGLLNWVFLIKESGRVFSTLTKAKLYCVILLYPPSSLEYNTGKRESKRTIVFSC